MGVAADVTRFTPADAQAVLWIPRVDRFTESVLTFGRGIREASRFRKLLEPETGVDLGDPDGLRRVGVDPEAGLVVFTRAGMAHILFGVEDADTFIEALRAKFDNAGFRKARVSEPDERGVVLTVVPGPDGDHAAFAAHDGLLVLVYRGRGEDPAAGVRAVLAGPKEVFFDTERFRELEAELGKEGPLVYASGDGMARRSDGEPRLGFLDSLKLPGLIDGMVRPHLAAWLGGLEWAAARLQVESCAARLHASVKGSDAARLLPTSWLMKDAGPGPPLGKRLPRDTVLFTRIGVRLEGAVALLEQISKLTTGIADLGKLLGLDTAPRDPIAAMLAARVHPDLADRHVVTDVLDHLTGHIGLAFAGVHRKARARDVLDTSDPKKWLGETVQLVAMLELKDARGFWEKWWPRRDVLGKLGFEVERMRSDEGDTASWHVLRLSRNCGKNVKRIKPRKRGQKPRRPPCESYGIILADDLLVFTTGKGTLPRVFDSMAGTTKALSGLTRENLARGVLERAEMTAGAYFSFDGLLRAVRNLNLPGGATRYLAQMYELAVTVDTTGGDLSSRVLLTR